MQPTHRQQAVLFQKVLVAILGIYAAAYPAVLKEFVFSDPSWAPVLSTGLLLVLAGSSLLVGMRTRFTDRAYTASVVVLTVFSAPVVALVHPAVQEKFTLPLLGQSPAELHPLGPDDYRPDGQLTLEWLLCFFSLFLLRDRFAVLFPPVAVILYQGLLEIAGARRQATDWLALGVPVCLCVCGRLVSDRAWQKLVDALVVELQEQSRSAQHLLEDTMAAREQAVQFRQQRNSQVDSGAVDDVGSLSLSLTNSVSMDQSSHGTGLDGGSRNGSRNSLPRRQNSGSLDHSSHGTGFEGGLFRHWCLEQEPQQQLQGEAEGEQQQLQQQQRRYVAAQILDVIRQRPEIHSVQAAKEQRLQEADKIMSLLQRPRSLPPPAPPPPEQPEAAAPRRPGEVSAHPPAAQPAADVRECFTQTDVVWGQQGFRCTCCSKPPRAPTPEPSPATPAPPPAPTSMTHRIQGKGGSKWTRQLRHEGVPMTPRETRLQTLLQCCHAWNVKLSSKRCCDMHALLEEAGRTAQKSHEMLRCATEEEAEAEDIYSCNGCGIVSTDAEEALSNCPWCGDGLIVFVKAGKEGVTQSPSPRPGAQINDRDGSHHETL